VSYPTTNATPRPEAPDAPAVYTRAALYLDELVHPLAPDVNVEELTESLVEAMFSGKVLKIQILTGDGRPAFAAIRPANAKIAFVHVGPFTVRPKYPFVPRGIGKSGG
jgi:hypothetical protein